MTLVFETFYLQHFKLNRDNQTEIFKSKRVLSGKLLTESKTFILLKVMFKFGHLKIVLVSRDEVLEDVLGLDDTF